MLLYQDSQLDKTSQMCFFNNQY